MFTKLIVTLATIDEDDEDPDRVVEECDCGGECHD